eukprot:637995-Hanusia_phi.AAC.1
MKGDGQMRRVNVGARAGGAEDVEGECSRARQQLSDEGGGSHGAGRESRLSGGEATLFPHLKLETRASEVEALRCLRITRWTKTDIVSV